MEKITTQQAVIEALEALLDQVKAGDFGKDNDFDRYDLKDNFEVLIMCY